MTLDEERLPCLLGEVREAPEPVTVLDLAVRDLEHQVWEEWMLEQGAIQAYERVLERINQYPVGTQLKVSWLFGGTLFPKRLLLHSTRQTAHPDKRRMTP